MRSNRSVRRGTARRLGSRLLLLSALATSAACSAEGPDLNVRLPDGRSLRLHCEGAGAPTVVLEAAYGSTWKTWGSVIAKLSGRTRVCGYNRAGLPGSDAGPLPRDGDAVARDLDAGLRAARIAGPYVLVGHSIGGLFVRSFYDRRPRTVAGMVLVDPTVEDQERRFAEAFPGSGGASLEVYTRPARQCVDAGQAVLAGKPAAIPDRCGKNPHQVVGTWSNMLSELENIDGATSSEIDAGPKDYGSLPLIVLTADGTYRGRPEQAWLQFHEEIARRSTRGESRLVANSSHDMPHDRPDAIVQAVEDVLTLSAQADRAIRPAPPRRLKSAAMVN